MGDLDISFNKILQNIGDEDIKDLRQIIKKYPFFQFPHFILARKFKNKLKNEKKLLEIASIYSTNRIKLKKFLSLDAGSFLKYSNFSYKEEDLSDDDSMFSNEVISQSLAEIMESQGKHKLAIKIFERLILKLPKKKSVFSEKIEELKKKL